MSTVIFSLGLFVALLMMGIRDIFLDRRKMFIRSFYALTLYSLFIVLNVVGIPIFDLFCYITYIVVVTMTPIYVGYKGSTLYSALKKEAGKMTIKRNLDLMLGKHKLINILYIVIMLALPICVFIGVPYLSYINMLFVVITGIRNLMDYISMDKEEN